jgi:hypothetical protein
VYEEMLSHLLRPICTRSQNTPAAVEVGAQLQQLLMSVVSENKTPTATDICMEWGHNSSN